MKLKAYEKIIWMSEFGVIYLLEPKSSLLVHPKSALWVYLWLHFLWCDYWRTAFKQILYKELN